MNHCTGCVHLGAGPQWLPRETDLYMHTAAKAATVRNTQCHQHCPLQMSRTSKWHSTSHLWMPSSKMSLAKKTKKPPKNKKPLLWVSKPNNPEMMCQLGVATAVEGQEMQCRWEMPRWAMCLGSRNWAVPERLCKMWSLVLVAPRAAHSWQIPSPSVQATQHYYVPVLSL